MLQLDCGRKSTDSRTTPFSIRLAPLEKAGVRFQDKDGIDNNDGIAYIVLQKNTQGDDMSIAVSIRLPDGLANELTHIADETERPRSFHIQRALESYIADFADVQIALDRLRDQKDVVVSGHELRKSLGL
ncbi:MAG: ribbon-helix-helix protein, CopG family [bacterium]